MYVYDYKFPDLSLIAYNHLRRHRHSYKVQPKFYVINFDDPRRSHRCNPIAAKIHDRHLGRLRVGLHNHA